MLRKRLLKWSKAITVLILALMCFVGTEMTARAQLNVPIYAQGGGTQDVVEPWENDMLGTNPPSSIYTFGDYGCAVTSIAMVQSYYGNTITPGELNTWLVDHNGFSGGGNVKWDVAGTLGPNDVPKVDDRRWQNVAAKLDVVNGYIDAGVPVIAEVRLTGYQHFVVITGRSGATYTINDPWYGDKNATFNTHYGNPSTGIYGIRVYKGTQPGGGTPGGGGDDTTDDSGLISKIRDFLSGSPLAEEAEHFVQWARQFDVDPRLVVGIAYAESSLGRSACGANDTGTWNAWGWLLGGSCWPNFRPGPDPDAGGIVMETGWEDGIYWVTHNLGMTKYTGNGDTTLDAIRTTYCGPVATHPECADGRWLKNVKDAFNAMSGDGINGYETRSYKFPTSDTTGGTVGSGNPSGGDVPTGTLYDAVTYRQDVDVTIPDGTHIPFSQTFTKTWRMVNSGTTAWNSNYKWTFVDGNQMSGPADISVANVAPGQTWDASVSLIAPFAPGTYNGYWRMKAPDGTFFGPQFWVEIVVDRVDNLQFISHVNYPDGAHVPVNQSFTKTWKVKNTGNVPWTTGYNFTFVSGDRMKDTNSLAVSGDIPAGHEANINLDLKAPSKPDTYTGYWRMKDNEGNFFGDTLKVQIVTTFKAHIQTTRDGSASNTKARLQKQNGANWDTVQDWKATPYDVSDLTKGVYRVQYSDENVPAWYQIPADETFNSDNLSGDTKTFTGNYPRVDWYAEFVSKPSDLTMKAGQMQQFTVTLKNRGSQSWTKANFHLGLKNAGSSEAGSFFLIKAADGSDSGWTSNSRIHSAETTIGTDQTATFTFTVRAPATAGTYTEHFSLINDGSGGFWFTDTLPHNNSAHNGPDIVWTITVQPDTPPHLDNQSITVDQDSSVMISLNPSGGNGNAWVVQNSRPRHGTLSEGTDSLSAVYTPDPGYVGQDSFTVRVSDGLLTSNTATISITVKPAAAPPADPDPDPATNIAPEALNQDLTARRNQSLSITLSGFDSDGDALSYQAIVVPRQLVRGRWVGGSPANGTLLGSGANLVYTPDANFRGRDSFQFMVSDGLETSVGTITITVR